MILRTRKKKDDQVWDNENLGLLLISLSCGGRSRTSLIGDLSNRKKRERERERERERGERERERERRGEREREREREREIHRKESRSACDISRILS